MIGLDTSFLVAVAVRDHPAHAACWRLFERRIRGRDASFALAPQVLAEFVHVVTDPRRFERPLDTADAIAVSEQWWHARECRQLGASPEAVSVFLGWMREHRLGRKRLLGTLLAATYHVAGVSGIATLNWRNFDTFSVFKVETLD